METPKKSPRKKRQKTLKLSGKITTEINIINEDQGKTPPIVGYFPSGFDPINKNSINLPIIKTFRNQKYPRRLELVVKPNISKVDYVGTNYSGEAAAGRLGINRLAVVDKANGTITFIPIASGKVFRLEPKVIKSDMSEKEPATPVKTEFTYEEKQEKRDRANDAYGTKAASKKDKQAKRLKQLDDTEAQKEIKTAIDQTELNPKALESGKKNTNPNLPPHDVSATTAADAYPLNKIILVGEYGFLNDVLPLLQAKEELKPDVYPTFVCNRSHKVVLIQDEKEKANIASIFSYISHLINFKNKFSLDGVAAAKSKFIPSMLLQKFSKMFLNTEKKRLADDKIEALLSLILVLTLHVDEFETDFTDIAKDLKMTAISLRPYFENLGCKFRSRNKVIVATLPVPLTFPTNRRKRRGRY